MIALIQRVRKADVSVENEIIGKIGQGLVVLLGVEKGDTQAKAKRLAEKLLAYRVFSDADDKMNLNVQQVDGELLVISQFTLAADTNTGTRPSFSTAAAPADANHLYEYFVGQCRHKQITTETGRFAADMQVSLVNDGPVTFWLQV